LRHRLRRASLVGRNLLALAAALCIRVSVAALPVLSAGPDFTYQRECVVIAGRLVMKFGGTSVANIDRIRNVARHVKREVDAGHDVAVVVSAMAGKTNDRTGARKPLPCMMRNDAVVASGEQVTSAAGDRAAGHGYPARPGRLADPDPTSDAHASARILEIDGTEIIHRFKDCGRSPSSPASRASIRRRAASRLAAAAWTPRQWRLQPRSTLIAAHRHRCRWRLYDRSAWCRRPARQDRVREGLNWLRRAPRQVRSVELGMAHQPVFVRPASTSLRISIRTPTSRRVR
jgi:hypothetical protein